MKTMTKTTSLLVVTSLVLVASSAAAQSAKPPPGTSCLDAGAGRGNVVYVTGSSALRPFLTALAPVVAADNPSYTIVYQSQGSCAGVAAVYEAESAKRIIKDVPAAGGKPANYAIYFNGDGTAQECFLDTTGAGETGTSWPNVDLGISDVFSKSCGYDAAPAGTTIADYFGPIQPMTFVVPSASSQRSIRFQVSFMLHSYHDRGTRKSSTSSRRTALSLAAPRATRRARCQVRARRRAANAACAANSLCVARSASTRARQLVTEFDWPENFEAHAQSPATVREVARTPPFDRTVAHEQPTGSPQAGLESRRGAP